MSADMGREKKMKNNLRRKKKQQPIVYVGRACHDSTLRSCRPHNAFVAALPANCRLRDYSLQAARPSCVALENFQRVWSLSRIAHESCYITATASPIENQWTIVVYYTYCIRAEHNNDA